MIITVNTGNWKRGARRKFMVNVMEKEIGEIKVSKYLIKKDTCLLRLSEAKVRMCTVPDDEAQSRGCTERGECEELVLVYRPFGCIKEKDDVDLNEVTTVGSEASPSSLSKEKE